MSTLAGKLPALVDRIWRAVEWRARKIGWIVFCRFLYGLTFLYRPLLRGTVFIGITGSAGKTTTKDLVAAILERHFRRGKKGLGTLNGPYDVARLVLRTRPWDAYCVTEIAITSYGIDMPIALFGPTVGAVTTIGAEHFSAFGGLEGIAEQKSKLVKALPPGGICILNADDSLALGMQSHFSGRTITYGLLNKDAMLRADGIQAAWPDRLSFDAHWNGRSVRVVTQLCGSHWVPVALAALATGVALGVPLAVAAEAVSGVEPYEGRMSPVELDDGVTFIRDDWKAPWWGVPSAVNFMRQARADRKIMVFGTISDCPGDSSRRYAQIAREALTIADCVLFVGAQASACLRAKRNPRDMLFAFPSLGTAAAYLSGYLRAGDLVLLKGGTRTDHLERLILSRTSGVQCWRSSCGRMYYCNVCTLLNVPAGPDGMPPAAGNRQVSEDSATSVEPSRRSRTPVVVVGLGNPQEHRADTRHNVGYRAVERVAEQLGQDWETEDNLAKVCRARMNGAELCLIKPLATMNDVGPPLLQLAKALDFDASHCILVHDDLDLPLGTVRARNRGSDGGHRGVRSIIQAFQNDKFRRVKIGIGKPGPGQSVVDYVLSPFPQEQHTAVDTATRMAADQILELIRQPSPSADKQTRGEAA